MKIATSLLIALAFVVSLVASAQSTATPEVGANPYKSYSGGNVDHIQMQNGSLYLRIPLLSYKQLGKLALSFSVLANGSQWHEIASCDPDGNCSYTYDNIAPGPCSTGPNNYVDASPGGGSAEPVVDQDLTVQSCWQQQDITDPNTGQTTTTYSWAIWDLLDSSEAAHTLGFDQSNWSRLQANDGSGYMLSVPCITSASTVTIDCSNTTSFEPSGVKHINAPVPQGAYGPPITTFQDPIGNRILRVSYSGSSSSPTGVIVDSVQRSIPDPTLLSKSNDVSHCPDLGITGQAAQQSEEWDTPGFGTYYFCYTDININTNFFGYGPGVVYQWCQNGNTECILTQEAQYSTSVLQSVRLPNGTYWGFEYDSATAQGQEAYGDLTHVFLPSGGSISYQYEPLLTCGDASNTGAYSYSRAILKRILSPLVGSAVSRSFQYTGDSQYGYTIETDADGNDVVHTFTPDYPGINYCGAEETSTKWFQGTSHQNTGGTVLKEEDTSYPYYALSPQGPYVNAYPSHINVLPKTKSTYLNGQLQSSITYGYDTLFTDSEPGTEFDSCCGSGPYMMPTAAILYEFPTTNADTIAKTVTQRYATTHASYQAAGMLSLPSVVTVYDSSGATQLQQTTYGYDESPSPQGVYGDETSVTRDNGVKTTTTYNNVGMPIQTTDANGNGGLPGNHTTTYTYDGTGVNLKEVDEPATGVSHVRYYQEDPNTGWLQYSTDENASGITDTAHRTAYIYDSIGRLTEVDYPDGGQVEQCYTDEANSNGLCSLGTAPYSVLSQRKQSATVGLTSSIEYDGLGRPIQSQDASGALIATSYDENGRVSSVSNPHFSSGSMTDGTTGYYYDAIGRKLLQCQPDNTPATCVPSGSNNSVQKWSYLGGTSSFTDENGNAWTRTRDAHNRLVQVNEPGNLTTTYAYDALDNLTSVSQVGTGTEPSRSRSFSYDALSRLVCASNPENSTGTCPTTFVSYVSGTVGYSYDPNGNVISRTDARGITAYYGYDSLNRLVSKTYSSNAPGGSFSSCYEFDTASNGVGLRGAAWTQAGSCAAAPPAYPGYQSKRVFGAYDAMGRVVSEQQCVLGFCTSSSPPPAPSNPNCNLLGAADGLKFCYDLAGNLTAYSNGLTSGAYPQQDILFSQAFDSAGRLASVSSSLNGNQGCLFNAQSGSTTAPCSQLPSQPTYGPFGGLENWMLGAGSLSVNKSYDNRLRVTGETATQQ